MNVRIRFNLKIILSLISVYTIVSHAQLVECEQINPSSSLTAVNACIAKSLNQQIGNGQGDVDSPDSSIYLINRDPARSIRRGRQLFQRKFTQAEGLGPRVNATSTGDITSNRALGAGLTDSCAACHGRPKGSAGFGGDVATRPDSRDAPHLFGLGIVEQLAEEMTEDLRAQRDSAIARVTGVSVDSAKVTLFQDANFQGKHVELSVGQYNRSEMVKLGFNNTLSSLRISPGLKVTLFNRGNFTGRKVSLDSADKKLKFLGSFNDRASSIKVEALPGSSSQPVTQALSSKGVDFGELIVSTTGEVDTSNVIGVDEDLRVRPFFHHGGTISIREFVIGAFKDEMGLQAWDPVLCAVTDPDTPIATQSPSGFIYEPDQDTFERPAVCDQFADADADGVAGEIDPALIDHMEFYLLNYFKPAQYKQSDLTRLGRRLMDQAKCTSCHVADLTIDSDRRVADVETNYDPQKGIFNDLFAVASTRFGTPIVDADIYPILPASGEPFVVKHFFSDLKRHDLGEGFYEREYDDSLVKEFVTEPLWGVGSTAPYGHDGRSINLDSVIRRHGGEAEQSRQLYENMRFIEQLAIQEFLNSLVLFPPDDTASNLNPGEPSNVSAIQQPAVHGNIRLSELFQIKDIGSE